MKTVDKNGVIVEGLERTASNGLVVRNKDAYNKYLIEKAKIERIAKLENDVSDLKHTVNSMFELIKTINSKV